MKATIKLYENDGSTDRGYPIKLILSHSRKTRRRTLSYAHVYDWDSDNKFPRSTHPDYDALFEKISIINKNSGKMEFAELDNFDAAFEYLLGDSKTVSQDFYKFGYTRVDDLNQRGQHGNAKVYNTALDALKKFRPHLSFKGLTHDLLRDFREYKKREGVKNSTAHNYLRTLRAIYNSAPRSLRTGENPFEGLFNKIPVKKRRARNRYFDKEQIDQIEKLEMPQSSLQQAIDLSLLQFYLCGVDLIDVYYLKKKDISNGRVFLRRKKLGERGEEFDVLLTDKARAIIDKYSEPTEDGYLFPWRKTPTGYQTFRNNHNRALGIVKEREDIVLYPRDDKWTTKVMRHTFATIGKHMHFEEDLLRELMGHERNDIDTVYKDKYPEQERDEAQLKIIS